MQMYLGWDEKCATDIRQVKMCPRSLTLSAELSQQSTFSDYKIADLSLERVASQVLDAHLLHDILKDPTEICTQILTTFLWT